MGLRTIELFSGAGGGVYAHKLLGHRVVCYVEQDEYCQRAIRQRIADGVFDDAPIWDDVRTFDGRPWRGRVDCVSGGFPCQPWSTAGKQRGEQDERDLWPEMRRIASECSAPFVFAENVQRKPIERAARDLADDGYTVTCAPLSAGDLGAWHERRRWWLLAHLDGAELREQSGRWRWSSRANTYVTADDGAEGVIPASANLDSEGERIVPVDGEMASLRKATGTIGPWTTEPGVERVVHGATDWSAQLRAAGNGQVPIVAAAAWRLLGGP
jgi:DNA (cytosine-5)-methyltransferase 1